MAGNFTSDKKLDIKWASMSLHWDNPTGDAFEPWLEKVKAAEYDGVTCFAFMGLECFLDKPTALRRALKNTDVELAAVDIPLDTTDDDYERVFDMMNEAGSGLMACIVHGANNKTPELYRYYADMLNRVAEKANARGICAHLHNNSDSIGRNFTDWMHLMPLIDWKKVFFMADTGHATKDFDEKPHQDRAITFLRDNWDKLHYMEFKDYNEVTDLDTPLGEGVCDYEGIFAMMKERGYTGWITLEQNENNGLSLGRSPEECARISRAFVRKGLGI